MSSEQRTVKNAHVIMNKEQIHSILKALEAGTLKADDAFQQLKDLPFRDIGHTKIDTHRAMRNGHPEVIYGENKTPQQVADIFKEMMSNGHNVLATRVDEEKANLVLDFCPQAKYNSLARTIFLQLESNKTSKYEIAIVTAGTADLPVAEEAKVTAEALGNRVNLIADVGVAGIHRLFAKMDEINKARVIIVIAGMEGALASVVAGLVDAPIIAVPTSVGYGASFGGLSALLTMMTSCANGVTVVNIDNGFGAAFAASQINQLS